MREFGISNYQLCADSPPEFCYRFATTFEIISCDWRRSWGKAYESLRRSSGRKSKDFFSFVGFLISVLLNPALRHFWNQPSSPNYRSQLTTLPDAPIGLADWCQKPAHCLRECNGRMKLKSSRWKQLSKAPQSPRKSCRRSAQAASARHRRGWWLCFWPY